MRNVYLMLLISGLCLAQVGRGEKQDLLALTTNFGPRRPSTNAEPEVAPAPRPVARPAISHAAQQSLKAESVHRQEAQLVGQQLITEGMKLYYAGKYEEAVRKFEGALKVLPRADASEVDYDRTVRTLGECYGRMAYAALQAGDKDKAKQYARKAIEFDPSNRGAENVLVKLKAAERETVTKAQREQIEAKKPKPVVEQPRLDRTPEFTAKQDEIRKLFREGRVLMNSGQLDEAEKRYKQILLIDHYNEDAYKNLQSLNKLRYSAATEGTDVTRRQRLWQVTEAWIPPVNGEIKPPEKPKEKVVDVTPSEREKIEHKLRIIKFPEVSFRDAAIVDVVRFLSDESRKVDPEEPKTGVDIVLGPGLGSGQAAPAPAPAPAPPPAAPGAPAAPAPAPAPEPSGPVGAKTITLSLRNVPMESALKYVCSLAGLKYRVESAAVVLLPSDSPEGEMVTKSYNVSPDAIRALLGGGGANVPTAPVMAPVLGGAAVPGAAPAGAAVPGAAAPAGGGGSEELRAFFTNAGVPFPAGSSLTYFERARTIYVRNTQENLEIFDKVIQTFNVVPSQVEIESKFVEITQTDLDELGFQWSLGPMTLNANAGANSISGMQGGGPSMGTVNGAAAALSVTNWVTQGLRGAHVFKANAVDSLFVGAGGVTPIADAIGTFGGFLNSASATMVINALSQKRTADVLSAPKVTTMSGAQAQIRVVQEFIYPSEFSQPTDARMPSMPTAFKTREVGVTLSVTPTVGADGYTINLTLTPEVSSFVGMLDYSPDDTVVADRIVGSTGGVLRIQPGGIISYKIWQPLFETRNLTTSVVIWDGQTVVIGGLIREEATKIDDKVPILGDVPVLGRLFRSKASNVAKRNLLMFVTARLIDPAGNLIHRPESPGFRFDPMGNPLRGTEPIIK